jgi:hypothetical protein
MPPDSFDDIPDPAAGIAAEPAPNAASPQEPSPTRAIRRRNVAITLALGALWMASVMYYLGIRRNISAVAVAVPLLLWIAVGAATLVLALRRGHRGMPPGARALQAIALAVPLIFLTSAYLSSPSGAPPVPWQVTRNCMLWASITSMGPFLLAAFLFQRSFLTAPAWRGAAIGTICGLCAATGIHAHCSVEASSHIILAHGLPIVSGAALGALLGALRGRV